jgi:hypothetical protein
MLFTEEVIFIQVKTWVTEEIIFKKYLSEDGCLQ